MDWTNLEGVENKIVKGLKGLEFPARGWACGVGGTIPTDRRIQYSPNLLPASPRPAPPPTSVCGAMAWEWTCRPTWHT